MISPFDLITDLLLYTIAILSIRPWPIYLYFRGLNSRPLLWIFNAFRLCLIFLETVNLVSQM